LGVVPIYQAFLSIHHQSGKSRLPPNINPA